MVVGSVVVVVYDCLEMEDGGGGDGGGGLDVFVCCFEIVGIVFGLIVEYLVVGCELCDVDVFLSFD